MSNQGQTSTLQPVLPQYTKPLPLSSDFFNNKNGTLYSVSSDWFTGVGSSGRVMNGIRPPVPSVVYDEAVSNQNYSELPRPTQHNYNLIKINSLREPFAVEHLVTQYGSETVPRLGTNMGLS